MMVINYKVDGFVADRIHPVPTRDTLVGTRFIASALIRTNYINLWRKFRKLYMQTS